MATKIIPDGCTEISTMPIDHKFIVGKDGSADLKKITASNLPFVIDIDYQHTDNNYSDDDEVKLAGIEAGAQVNAAPVANLNSTDDTLPLAASQGKILADKIPYLITKISVNTVPDGSGNFQIATGLKLSNILQGATAANVTSSIIFDNQTTDISNGKNLIYSIIIENDYIFICGLTGMSPIRGDFYISFRIN